MSACEQYEAAVSALIDGELDAAEESALRAHLETCPDCRALYETLSLLHMDAAEPPEGLTARIMDAIHAEAADNIVPMPKPKKRRWQAFAIAAAAVLVIAAVSLPRLRAQQAENVSTAAVRSVPQEPAEQTEQAAVAAPDDDAEDSAAAPMALTEPSQIEDVRAMLEAPADTQAPEAAEPILTLAEDGAETELYLDGDDVLYTTDGTQYYRCENAAEALIEYLSEL